MLEKDIQKRFINEWHYNLQSLFKLDTLRLYAIELPLDTNDGRKYADLIYEFDEHKCPMDNMMFVLELKKDPIDTGVVDQVMRYAYYTEKRLYRRNGVFPVIAGPDFSKWEQKISKENDVALLQYDLAGNMRFLS